MRGVPSVAVPQACVTTRGRAGQPATRLLYLSRRRETRVCGGDTKSLGTKYRTVLNPTTHLHAPHTSYRELETRRYAVDIHSHMYNMRAARPRICRACTLNL